MIIRKNTPYSLHVDCSSDNKGAFTDREKAEKKNF